jgi:hypothetical protein
VLSVSCMDRERRGCLLGFQVWLNVLLLTAIIDGYIAIRILSLPSSGSCKETRTHETPCLNSEGFSEDGVCSVFRSWRVRIQRLPIPLHPEISVSLDIDLHDLEVISYKRGFCGLNQLIKCSI